MFERVHRQEGKEVNAKSPDKVSELLLFVRYSAPLALPSFRVCYSLFGLALFPCLFAPDDRASDAIRPSQAVPAAACALLYDPLDAPSRLAWPASTDDPEAPEDGEWY